MTFTFKLAPRLVRSHVVSAVALGFLVGSCAPGKPLEGGLEPPPNEVVAVHLVPDSVSLNPAEFVDFTAIAELQSGAAGTVTVTWQAGGGTITAAGRYTAGGTAGSYRVIGQYQGGPADTATVVVTVTAPPPPVLTRIDVTPITVALLPAGVQQFSATGVMSDGSSSSVGVSWTTTGGTVSASGSYVAPATTGNYLVVATQQGGSLSDTAQVSVGVPPPTLAAVILTPVTASLEFGRTQQFTAVGQLSDGSNTTIPITWTSTGGTISASGLYTAGSTAGNFRVIARSANGLADTSAVTITAPTITAITLTPATASLQSGQTQQFSVSATLSNGGTQANPSVTWVATGGAINATGLYTAGATAGSFRVIASSSNGRADTSAVTIATPTITAITVTPATASLQSGQTQQFTAAATLSNGGTQANPSVTWSATGGSITTGGLYTAGSTTGTFRAIATAAGGAADTSSVTISTPTITAITVTPGTVSVGTGRTQQFTASATLSNGGTQANPAVTWSATGGTISTGGLYTAGSTTGGFRVIAVQQSGTLADTSAVTVASTSSAWLANKPANYVTFSEVNFNQAIPSPGGPLNTPIGGGFVIPFGNNYLGNFSLVSDPTAPASGPNVWRLRIPAGTYDPTGIGPPYGVGSGSGSPFGDFGLDVAALGSTFKQDLYVAVAVKWGLDDGGANYEWHPVSNKWFEIDSPSMVQMLIESNGQSRWITPQLNYAPNGGWAGDNPGVTGRLINHQHQSGVWHVIEFIINRGNPGRIRVWEDGVLWGDYQNVPGLPAEGSGAFHEFYFRNFRGGGTEVKTRDSYIYYDHILLASPQQ